MVPLVQAHTHETPVRGVEEYVLDVLHGLRARSSFREGPPAGTPVPDAIFRELTSQRFGYLGRSRSEPYRPTVVAHLERDVALGRPLRFFYDIGPGYHASLSPDHGALLFDVGFTELVLLRQVVEFCNRVRESYEPGARFWLVIDNLCGRATNDIPLERSLGYVAQLRRLVDAVGARDVVGLLVESEVSSWEEYEARLEVEARRDHPVVDAADVENVARFLGRPCSHAEAAERIERYRRTGIVTEALLEPAIEGVRLTQRASALTLGFRAFPGGDQRIQVGELALGPGRRDRLHPFLVTSRNASQYTLLRVDVSAVAPDPVRTVLFAQPVGD